MWSNPAVRRGDDWKRWLVLPVLLSAIALVVIGNTVVNVALPTMVRELDSDLLTMQWVVTGYALVFATFLVIGGRLGDIFGARRMFMSGAVLFGVGSIFGATAPNVALLLVGEALIKGMGAALLMPASLSLVSNTFRGSERATAFAAWGAVVGAGMAFGPVVGGYFTTYHSWRWAFGINIVLAPLAALGARLLLPVDVTDGVRRRLDLPGAALIASGIFALVFTLSQGRRYGWSDRLIVGALTVAVVSLLAFVRVERRREAEGTDALFALSQLRLPGFRYGLLAQLVLAVGQMGQFFVLPLFLQDALGLTPAENGLWMMPMGIAILAFAQLGGRLTRTFGTVPVVRVGLVLNTAGLLVMALSLTPDVSFLDLAPGFLVFGAGIGLASSQLTNVIMAEVAHDKAGVAGGANSTVRQVGSALGVAAMGAILTGATDTAASARTAVGVSALMVAVGAIVAFRIPSDGRPLPVEGPVEAFP